jgi:hypothetical protein
MFHNMDNVNFNIVVFWDAAQYSIVETVVIIWAKKAVRTTETSDVVLQTTRNSIPEDTHFHARRRVNLKTHNFNFASAFIKVWKHQNPVGVLFESDIALRCYLLSAARIQRASLSNHACLCLQRCRRL